MSENEIDYYQLAYDKFLQIKEYRWCDSYFDSLPSEYFKPGDIRSSIFDKIDNGWDKSRNDFIRPYVLKILEQLTKIENELAGTFCAGCGCCGGGYYVTVEGIQYEYDPQDFKENVEC